MIYISEANGFAVFTAYPPASNYFVIDNLPECHYQNDDEHIIKWKCDIGNKKVWYEIEFIKQPTQLDRIEELMIETNIEVQYLSALQELGV
ncbi:MAG: hypothetical protein KIC65_09690 [Firmicutes bacterium]|nr:hypothetical protein [Bacillota bacterium]